MESQEISQEQDQDIDICYLPIFALKNEWSANSVSEYLFPPEVEQSINWILGKIVMEDYYTVFDLSSNNQDDDYVEITLGAKNPKYKGKLEFTEGGDENVSPSIQPEKSNDDPSSTEFIDLATLSQIEQKLLIKLSAEREHNPDAYVNHLAQLLW